MSGIIGASTLVNPALVEDLEQEWVINYSNAALAAALRRRFPWTYYAKDIGSRAVQDPIARKYNWIWSVFNPFLSPDKGDLNYVMAEIQKHFLETDPFNIAIAFDLDEIRNPVIARLYADQVRRLGQAPTKTRDRTVFAMLDAGDTAAYGLCYDGQELFSTDHPGKDVAGAATTFSNLFAAEGAPSDTTITTVLDEMATYRDASGQHFGNRWVPPSPGMMGGSSNRNELGRMVTFHIMGGLAYQKTLADIVNPNKDNPSVYAGSFTYECVDEIPDDTWFVMFKDEADASMVLAESIRKPLCYLSEYGDSGRLSVQAGRDDSDMAVEQNKGRISIRDRHGFAYDSWHVIAKVTE